MKGKVMGIKEILRLIWLISANKIKTFESVGKLSSQLKLELNSSLWQNIAFEKFRDKLQKNWKKLKTIRLYNWFGRTVSLYVGLPEAPFCWLMWLCYHVSNH